MENKINKLYKLEKKNTIRQLIFHLNGDIIEEIEYEIE